VSAETFLLIGAGGLVGSHLRSALAGQRVICTYRRSVEPGALALDITSQEPVRRAIREVRPTVVILAAAEAHVEACERDPDTTRRVNVDAARVVADAARAVGARLIVFSSEYVFDGTAGTYVEDDERRPLNEYGRQKVALEDIALAMPTAVVCRTSGVFGYDAARKNFVCQLVDRLGAGAEFAVASDQSITPTYAPSLARAVVELALGGYSGTFHVAGPRILNRVEFARMAADAYGVPTSLLRPRKTSELGLMARRPLACGLDVTKLEKTLGHGLTDPESALAELAARERAA